MTTTIFETLVEESLVQPTFVYDFPTEVSPLSKQRPDDPDTVERFELYIGKMFLDQGECAYLRADFAGLGAATELLRRAFAGALAQHGP